MKKIINNPKTVVEEMLEGLAIASPSVKLLKGTNVIVRADCRSPEVLSKVALISGGGSGHEPAHAGYVGKGMLSAAVCGNIFASPPPSQVLEAIRAVTGPAGVLLIVKNYTGDRLNFGIAAEMARSEGYLVEIVIVADDCALIGSENAGRRGLAGTVLVHKIAGAAAESGLSLTEVTRIAKSVAERVGTIGLGLSACTVPAAGKPSFQLEGNEVELGLGIHGEPGVQKMKLKTADEFVELMLTTILNKCPSFRTVPAVTHVVLLINNLGATTAMELHIVAKRAVLWLEQKGLTVERVYSGFFITALDMAGISITLLPINEIEIPLLDLATTAPGWPHIHLSRPQGSSHYLLELHTKKHGKDQPSAPTLPLAQHDNVATLISQFISCACNTLLSNKIYLDDLDSQVGDGDIGSSLEQAAHQLLVDLPGLTFQNPPAAFTTFAHVLQTYLGGTSGPLYTVFFLRLAAKLQDERNTGKDYRDPQLWASALLAGTKGIQDLGGANKGDCTMLDALIPAVEAIATLANSTPAAELSKFLEAAEKAAQEGAESTKKLRAKKGRASYLGERSEGHVDPGAQAIALIFRSFLQIVQHT